MTADISLMFWRYPNTEMIDHSEVTRSKQGEKIKDWEWLRWCLGSYLATPVFYPGGKCRQSVGGVVSKFAKSYLH